MINISASLMCADPLRLGDEIEALKLAGVDWLHFDIMDGHYVKSLGFTPSAVERAKAVSGIPLDVHLMVDDPDRWAPEFVKAGADYLTVHLGACPQPLRTLTMIRNLGAKAGIALNPAEPAEPLKYMMELLDLIVLMTVEPGFAGQRFISAVTPKICEVDAMLAGSGSPALISVDGAIGPVTIPQVVSAGADVLVAGSSALFKGPGTDYGEEITRLRSMADKHLEDTGGKRRVTANYRL